MVSFGCVGPGGKLRLARERRLIAGSLLVPTTVASICDCPCLLDLRDGSHHTDEKEAVRGLRVEGGISGRDDPHTSGRQLAENEGEVLRPTGQAVQVVDDEHVDFIGPGCRQYPLQPRTFQRAA
jgi:hypothetical protein